MIEPVLRLAAQKLGYDVAPTVDQVKNRVFEAIANKRTQVISNLAQREIEQSMHKMGKLAGDSASFSAAYQNAIVSVDPGAIYARWEVVVSKLVTEGDYELALRYYKIKGLAAEAANPVYGVKFQDQIMRWMRGTEAKEFIDAMLTAFPA